MRVVELNSGFDIREKEPLKDFGRWTQEADRPVSRAKKRVLPRLKNWYH